MENKKLKTLQNKRTEILKKMDIAKKKLEEENENEEVWPGHESTVYFDNLNNYQVLVAHLEAIESEIKLIKSGATSP
ncbi:hypothetical protein A3D84_05970 [Candidatus Woesebacteria bacterium RIFCSPHIGHO2_02_FULL_42_20]|uniref:Uncharacterized protein n=1 Tax=Candidatus Woesebacteria bacterium RIFCSPHIGHO2_12_FULL_41_24 TaxID=1802510 RepID=A0A1F8AWE8_9BACT|nr:MAG: hypothetical protein A2873_02955 [Candidatus Woesebacteria bacterium RIFCSPHIGHO2_01_FULL_42_80]OGM35355.1 MAG: hypothetical protein A3D84_05970 [Candidatus Woesebacteria bacterium RIFCSPHIGHO2_02_FULL_42_20]OGM55575.1 MAG: hypothetical protein A3E44_04910 [Candidatus Woesebacteria bacterium RIFCSPHIGHO2_12_FULL_41_24]OGM71662.1 MAG: hypothetical protein A3I55_00160 [Candidatus Woesebacteria bacterium RIFCSPLOWO2_02_FULL_42_10]OGM72127.1 MAG: hypothetical protein A3H21_04155 [Candidatus